MKLIEKVFKDKTEQDLYNSIINAKGFKVLRFWGENCPPCKAMESWYELLKKSNDSEGINFIDIQGDEGLNGEIYNMLSVRGFPTLMLIDESNEVLGRLPTSLTHLIQQAKDLGLLLKIDNSKRDYSFVYEKFQIGILDTSDVANQRRKLAEVFDIVKDFKDDDQLLGRHKSMALDALITANAHLKMI